MRAFDYFSQQNNFADIIDEHICIHICMQSNFYQFKKIQDFWLFLKFILFSASL
jgi:hypothetical protein